MIKKSLILGVFIFVLVGAMFAVVAAENDSNGSNDKAMRNIDQSVRAQEQRMRERPVFKGSLSDKPLTAEQKAKLVGLINNKTGANITEDMIGNGTIGSVLRQYVSNGRFAFVRIMPETASARAIERLNISCVERNCSLELREMKRGNNSTFFYEVKGERDAKLLGFMKKKMVVVAEVDAENGTVRVHKPWWAFLAK